MRYFCISMWCTKLPHRAEISNTDDSQGLIYHLTLEPMHARKKATCSSPIWWVLWSQIWDNLCSMKAIKWWCSVWKSILTTHVHHLMYDSFLPNPTNHKSIRVSCSVFLTSWCRSIMSLPTLKAEWIELFGGLDIYKCHREMFGYEELTNINTLHNSMD